MSEENSSSASASNTVQKPEWRRVERWVFDFTTQKPAPAEVWARVEETLLMLGEMAAILAVADVTRLLEQGHDFAISRYANVMEMLASNAMCAVSDIERRQRANKQ